MVENRKQLGDREAIELIDKLAESKPTLAKYFKDSVKVNSSKPVRTQVTELLVMADDVREQHIEDKKYIDYLKAENEEFREVSEKLETMLRELLGGT